jgi:hypothetical protein
LVVVVFVVVVSSVLVALACIVSVAATGEGGNSSVCFTLFATVSRRCRAASEHKSLPSRMQRL